MYPYLNLGCWWKHVTQQVVRYSKYETFHLHQNFKIKERERMCLIFLSFSSYAISSFKKKLKLQQYISTKSIVKHTFYLLWKINP